MVGNWHAPMLQNQFNSRHFLLFKKYLHYRLILKLIQKYYY